MVCSPDLYQGDYPEDLIYLTRSTSMVLSGFQESTGYTCTLSTLDNEGSLHDDSVHINVKSLGAYVHYCRFGMIVTHVKVYILTV